MNVIVSTLDLKWSKFKVYDRLANVPDWGTVDYLVYNSSKETLEEIFAALSDIPATLKGIVYVSDYMYADKRGDALYAYFKSIGAYIYTDVDEILSDEDMLQYIIENLGEVGTELAAPNNDSLGKLGFYVDKLSKGEISLSNISTIDGIVKDLSTDIQLLDNSTKRMSKSLSNISKSLSDLSKKEVESHDQLLAFSTKLEELAANAGGGGYIAPYKVPFITRQAIYIKGYGDVPYLVTFIKNYCSFLKNVEQLNCKLLIIRPPLLVYDKLYSRDKSIFKLDSNNIRTSNISNFDNFVTYEPLGKIFDKFYSFGTDVDIYFVIDLTQQMTEIMQGHMVKSFGAFSSIGAYSSLIKSGMTLPDMQHSIFSITGVQGSIVIPNISGFESIGEDLRASKYFNECQGMFQQLSNLIDIN